ncbi:MAG: 50S ribosomal protein L25 [Peptococcia bacterium]
MDNIKAELRDQSIKAKKLRRMGKVPACIYGSNLEESVLIQISQTDINSLLSTKTRGNALTIEVNGKKYNVLFKDYSRQPVSNQVEHVDFQNLVADEPVNSVAQIVVLNRDENENVIQQHIEEVPYSALPSHLVERISINVAAMEVGSSVTVGDLEIAKDENITLLVPEDTLVLNVVEKTRAVVDVEEEKTEAVEETPSAE